MNLQIKPLSSYDPKLLQNFPQDPYSDICITLPTRKLHLILSYLSIDSLYFSKIDPDTKQINLSQQQQFLQHQQSLIRVIRSLYGGELSCSSIKQLEEIYRIVEFLEIFQYKENVQKQIMKNQAILQSIEFLEFSCKYDVLVEEVFEWHIKSKMKMLQSNRNYLQLNKISISTFQRLLGVFMDNMLSQNSKNNKTPNHSQHSKDKQFIQQNLLSRPQSQIINHVMQNYFNRNNIKAAVYFKSFQHHQHQQYQLGYSYNYYKQLMEIIWNKFHHTIYYNNFSNVMSNSNSNINSKGNSSKFIVAGSSTGVELKSSKYYQMKATTSIGSQQSIISGNGNTQGYTNNFSKTQGQGVNYYHENNTATLNFIDNSQKYKRISQLQMQLKQRDQIIASLQKQIRQLSQSNTKILMKQKQRKQPKKLLKNTGIMILDVDDFGDQVNVNVAQNNNNNNKNNKNEKQQQNQDTKYHMQFDEQQQEDNIRQKKGSILGLNTLNNNNKHVTSIKNNNFNNNNPSTTQFSQQDQQSFSFLPHIKPKRRSNNKQFKQQQQDFTVSSVFEPAFNNMRKIPQLKQIRTMKKVCGGGGLNTIGNTGGTNQYQHQQYGNNNYLQYQQQQQKHSHSPQPQEKILNIIKKKFLPS